MSNQWKLVPVEPTETMVIHGFESAPDECFSDEEVWEQYQEMSGCQQAAFRAKLCWAAMLAAAPVPQQADLDRVIVQPAPVAVVLPERLQQVLKFLDGAENLDGYWFGEPGPHGSKVWWRAELRKALEETNLFAKQQ